MRIVKRNMQKTHITLPLFIICFYGLMPILSSSEHSAYFQDVFMVLPIQLWTILVYKRISLTKNVWIYMGLFISAFISTFFSDYVQIESTIISYLLLCLITIIFAGFQYTEDDIKRFINFYVLYGLICSVCIILSWFFEFEYQWNRYSLDIVGLHKNPNYINNIILLAMAFVLHRLIRKEGNPLINIFYCIVMCASVFLTATRAAFLCIIVLCMFSILYILIIKKRFLYIFLFGIFAAGAYAFFVNFIPPVIVNRLTSDMMNDSSRLFMWENALKELWKQPVLGMGLSGVTAYNTTISSVEAIHNVLLQFLCDQGIIGGILFILLLLSILNRVKKNDRILFALMIIALFVPIMFQNGTVSFTFWWPLALLEIFSNVSLRCGIYGRQEKTIGIDERL